MSADIPTQTYVAMHTLPGNRCHTRDRREAREEGTTAAAAAPRRSGCCHAQRRKKRIPIVHGAAYIIVQTTTPFNFHIISPQRLGQRLGQRLRQRQRQRLRRHRRWPPTRTRPSSPRGCSPPTGPIITTSTRGGDGAAPSARTPLSALTRLVPGWTSTTTMKTITETARQRGAVPPQHRGV